MSGLLDQAGFFAETADTPLAAWHPALREALAEPRPRHGKEAEWAQALRGLRLPPTDDFDLSADCIRIGSACALSSQPLPSASHALAADGASEPVPAAIARNADGVQASKPLSSAEELAAELRGRLKALCPWRKGPFEFFGVRIDAEWRSDWKWRRLAAHLSPLAGRLVLDIGCGNGYYLLRMLGAGARLALGVDPSRLFAYQFGAIKQNLRLGGAHLLPLPGERLPALGCMDTVFSMGVLYHRRSPGTHLRELFGFLRPGGELVVETLVAPGGAGEALRPKGRYAAMGNAHCIPSVGYLEAMLAGAGFVEVRTVDVTPTTTEEQRRTEWMGFQSLEDFLDPQDSSRTIEGYPAPVRALALASRPG